MRGETPKRQVTLPAYWIGRYPVTNVEYAMFVEDGGYRNQAYWAQAGWRARGDRTQPWYWEDERYNGPQMAVAGPEWYGAVAYCNWLSARTGRRYRLPSEAEWEKAARGTDGRIWPWGDEFDMSRCRAWESATRIARLVGQCSPQGDSPYGCADMSGLKWEWCATKLEVGYENYTGDNDLEGDARRVLRGGSNLDVTWGVRCAFRHAEGPGFHDQGSSFRVAADPP